MWSALSFPLLLMLKILLFVALGGGAGSVCRYLLSRLLSDAHCLSLSWPTLAANVFGSLLIGAFYALSDRFSLSQEVRLLLTTGFCGGFTTFSTFSYENMLLLRNGDYLTFLLYVVLSLSLCLVGVMLGSWFFSR